MPTESEKALRRLVQEFLEECGETYCSAMHSDLISEFEEKVEAWEKKYVGTLPSEEDVRDE